MTRFHHRLAGVAGIAAATLCGTFAPQTAAQTADPCPEPVGVPINPDNYGIEAPPRASSAEEYRYLLRQRQLARRLALLQARLAARTADAVSPEPLPPDPSTGGHRSQPPVSNARFNSVAPLADSASSPLNEPSTPAVRDRSSTTPATENPRTERNAEALQPTPTRAQPLTPTNGKVWEVRRSFGDAPNSPAAPETKIQKAGFTRISTPQEASPKEVRSTVQAAAASAEPTSLPSHTKIASSTRANAAPTHRIESSQTPIRPTTETRSDDSDVSSKYSVGGRWSSGGKW